MSYCSTHPTLYTSLMFASPFAASLPTSNNECCNTATHRDSACRSICTCCLYAPCVLRYSYVTHCMHGRSKVIGQRELIRFLDSTMHVYIGRHAASESARNRCCRLRDSYNRYVPCPSRASSSKSTPFFLVLLLTKYPRRAHTLLQLN